MNSSLLYAELFERLQSQWVGLPDKPDETPETTLDSLWKFTCGKISTIGPAQKITSEEEERLRKLVELRLSGVPMAYLIGRQVFMGIEFLSSPEAMIPRKETEILAKLALDIAHSIKNDNHKIKVMDLCTGSGNIALTLGFYESNCVVVGADLSSNAVELARRNAAHLGLTGRVSFFPGDLFEPFEKDEYLGKMDLISCNPPYISTTQVEKLAQEIVNHEPRLAFDGGPFGVKILTRFIREAPRFLRPEGWICFEVGVGQGKALTGMLTKTGKFENIEPSYDEAHEIRALKASLKILE